MEINDSASIYLLVDSCYKGARGVQQDHAKAMKLYARSGELGLSKAHYYLGLHYSYGGDLKKAKFHNEAAAMAGHELARFNLGCFEAQSRNIERAIKHWTIAASAGEFNAMHILIKYVEKGFISRESIDSTLAAYNNSWR